MSENLPEQFQGAHNRGDCPIFKSGGCPNCRDYPNPPMWMLAAMGVMTEKQRDQATVELAVMMGEMYKQGYEQAYRDMRLKLAEYKKRRSPEWEGPRSVVHE